MGWEFWTGALVGWWSGVACAMAVAILAILYIGWRIFGDSEP